MSQFGSILFVPRTAFVEEDTEELSRSAMEVAILVDELELS